MAGQGSCKTSYAVVWTRWETRSQCSSQQGFDSASEQTSLSSALVKYMYASMIPPHQVLVPHGPVGSAVTGVVALVQEPTSRNEPTFTLGVTLLAVHNSRAGDHMEPHTLKSTCPDEMHYRSLRLRLRSVITESAALDQGLQDGIACFMPRRGTF